MIISNLSSISSSDMAFIMPHITGWNQNYEQTQQYYERVNYQCLAIPYLDNSSYVNCYYRAYGQPRTICIPFKHELRRNTLLQWETGRMKTVFLNVIETGQLLDKRKSH